MTCFQNADELENAIYLISRVQEACRVHHNSNFFAVKINGLRPLCSKSG